MLDIKKVYQEIDRRYDEIVQIRRYLHMHPELSFHETGTAAYIADFYKGKDVEIVTDIGGGHGIVVTLKGKNPGKTAAVRADFDALPIQEENDIEYKSQNPGVMHACGHDGHTAYLMILADILIGMKEDIDGTIKFIHQPAEETPPGGAKTIMESGILDDVDSIFGIHVMTTAPLGTVGYHSGVTQAGRSYFKVRINGKGGHGSMPHLSNDPIVAASHFVVGVQSIVSRRVNPLETAVVTIGSFDGKGSFNVINDHVELEGDVRTLSGEVREQVKEEFETILDGIMKAYKCTYELIYSHDYPVLVNNPEMTELVVNAIKNSELNEVKDFLDCGQVTGSEDMAYYLEKIPGAYYYVGARPEGDVWYPHHHPKFNIDEESLRISAKTMAAVIKEYLEK